MALASGDFCSPMAAAHSEMASFIFEKEIDSNINLKEIAIPPLITQPLIENAIWHGLLPLRGTRVAKLILRISLVNNNLTIAIIDNGVGRDKNVIKSNFGKIKESRGIWLIQNWIENLNQLIAKKSAYMEFIDLQDENEKPNGTQVNIVLALNNLYQFYNDTRKES